MRELGYILLLLAIVIAVVLFILPGCTGTAILYNDELKAKCKTDPSCHIYQDPEIHTGPK